VKKWISGTAADESIQASGQWQKHREHGLPVPREFPAGGAAVLDLSGFCLMPAADAGCQLRIIASTASATPPRIERHYAVPGFDLQ
jgi:hypothetical protein